MNLIIDGKAHINVGNTVTELCGYVRKFITENNFGASDIGSEYPVLNDAGKRIAICTYNGRMFEPVPYSTARKEITSFNNTEA